MLRFFTIAALAFALGTIPLSPSVAQNADQRGPMAGMMGGGCPMLAMMGQGMMASNQSGQGMMAGRQPRMVAMVDGRLAYLKGALNITDAQNVAWNGYADAVKARVEIMQGMRQIMIDAMQKGSAIGRMNARIKSMETMVDSMKAVKPATEKLYAVLTDEQKKVADRLIGEDCGAM
jgi:LTXXQ motif family protein